MGYLVMLKQVIVMQVAIYSIVPQSQPPVPGNTFVIFFASSAKTTHIARVQGACAPRRRRLSNLISTSIQITVMPSASYTATDTLAL